MSEPVLELENIVFSYGKGIDPALNGVSLSVGRGVKTVILGANGAGKSTLFGIMNALYRPDKGTVKYNGVPYVYRKKAVTRIRTDVSILFQNPDDMLFKPYVGQDVAYGPENLGLPSAEVEIRVRDSLRAVGMLEYRDKPTMRLSYGQRKRVALAGVLAMQPKVLILDEPTAGLDPQMASEVMEIAEQLHRNGTTVIMSSHDTDLVYSWADEVHVLMNGRCVYSGVPEGFYRDKNSVYLAGLLQPKVFLMNEGLATLTGCSVEPYPRTRSQLVGKTIGSGRGCGRLYVLPVPGMASDETVVKALSVAGISDMPKGIYGRSARKARNIASVGIDYMYDGPENCFLKCMEGKDSLLLCDPDMVDIVVSMVSVMASDGFGTIECSVLEPAEKRERKTPKK
ncbi:MAG: energy-coupling factor ABC transporter ATP-binding protein [archaeon]|nr:energy-coupling factor ABC transporter ATP-binding protein [archaeon]